MKKFFKRLGAFFKHVWTKYRDNWFKITFYCLLVFILSCAFLRSCKGYDKPQATLTASADEVEQPVQRSEEINYANYAFNIFPYPYTVDLTGTPLEDIVTFGADGSIVLNGTLSADDYNSSDSYSIRFAILNDSNSQLVGGRRYYFHSVPQVAKQVAGIITNYRAGGIYSGSFDYVAGIDVYFTLRVTANTFNNFVISPALYYSSNTMNFWTPPLSILLNQYYDNGFADGYDNGTVDGYLNGYDIGISQGKQEGFILGQSSLKLGIFYNSTLNLNISYANGSTYLTNYDWQYMVPSGAYHGIDIGTMFYNDELYSLGNSFFTSFVATITFNDFVPNSVDFYLTNLPNVSNFQYLTSNGSWVNTCFMDDKALYVNDYQMSTAYALAPADSVSYKAVRFTYTYSNEGNNSSQPYYKGLAFFTYTNSFAEGLQQGMINTQQKVDEAYTNGYNAGYNKGREVDSQGYTFLSLIDAVGYGVTKPFVSILNFDLLGMNMLSFVTGLLTLVLIVKLCSLFI